LHWLLRKICATRRRSSSIEASAVSGRFLFTIFTPVYNRAHTLRRVFDSLCAQTLRDFEWLVIDDGSTDNTADLIAGWTRAADFPIRYFKQAHSGKHIAHNLAAREARGQFFLPLDSDDACLPDALERMAYHWNAIPVAERGSYAGVEGLCIDQEGRVVGDEFPTNPCDMTVRERCYVYRIGGEKWASTRTEIARMYPFADIRETYIPEGAVWLQIGRKFKYRCVNEVFRVYYIDDDLAGASVTTRIRGLDAYAPGRLHFYTYVLNNDLEYFFRSPLPFLKAAVILPILAHFAKQGCRATLRSLNSMPAKALVLSALPISFGLCVFDRMRNRVRARPPER
jgi:glycosyltransferase involved in cell wall biosynthesis